MRVPSCCLFAASSRAAVFDGVPARGIVEKSPAATPNCLTIAEPALNTDARRSERNSLFEPAVPERLGPSSAIAQPTPERHGR